MFFFPPFCFSPYSFLPDGFRGRFELAKVESSISEVAEGQRIFVSVDVSASNNNHVVLMYSCSSWCRFLLSSLLVRLHVLSCFPFFFLKAVCMMGNSTTKLKRWSPKSLVSTAAAETGRYVVTCKSARFCTTFIHRRQVASWWRGRTPAARNCIVVSTSNHLISKYPPVRQGHS